MPNKEYFNFLASLLYNYKSKHLWVLFISSILVAIISSFLFVTSAIKRDLFISLDAQSDFVVQKFRAGNIQEIPIKWKKEFEGISGVDSVTARVYGMHYYDPLETHFMIVGIDFLDVKARSGFSRLLKDIDVEEFLSKNHMIMGSGVKKLFDYYEYTDNYIFRPPDRSKTKVFFHSEFPKESQVITNDMIIMDINVAREILGVPKEYATDIAINVLDESVLEDVKIQLILSHFDMRIIEKREMKRYYENLFNYKGGVFLALYLISLLTFLLILYQRYTSITYTEAKEIALLRIAGWKISDVIWLKLSENFIVVLVSYMLGVIMAYLYVFVFDAPLIKEIFLGFQNLENSVAFSPFVEFSSLVLIFLIFVIPFMLAILIPVYKIAITEPTKVMR